MKQRMVFTALKQQFAHTLFFAIFLYIRPAQAVAQGHLASACPRSISRSRRLTASLSGMLRSTHSLPL